MKRPRFSVVINTYNRAPYLADCLRALQFQTFPDFEVVVVNGPSDDGTNELLKKWSGTITRVDISERNLSLSRNVGIAHAEGEIVAFIDDDAVAEMSWLAEIDKIYRIRSHDQSLAGCGGFVIDHTGRSYQAEFQMCNRLGVNYNASNNNPRLFSYPGSYWVPYNMGTNTSFYRDRLKEIGGFDEEYVWFYDESDLTTRLVDAGYYVDTNPNALVFHRYAQSHLRDPERIPKTIFYPARSFAYL